MCSLGTPRSCEVAPLRSTRPLNNLYAVKPVPAIRHRHLLLNVQNETLRWISGAESAEINGTGTAHTFRSSAGRRRAEMSAFGRVKENIFRTFLKLKHAIPSHDTFSAMFRMVDPKALDAAFGRVLADVTAPARARGMSSPPVARRYAAPATRARARGRG